MSLFILCHSVVLRVLVTDQVTASELNWTIFRVKLLDIQSETAFRQTKQQPKTVVSEQVCVQPPTYSNNVALPAFGRAAID